MILISYRFSNLDSEFGRPLGAWSVVSGLRPWAAMAAWSWISLVLALNREIRGPWSTSLLWLLPPKKSLKASASAYYSTSRTLQLQGSNFFLLGSNNSSSLLQIMKSCHKNPRWCPGGDISKGRSEKKVLIINIICNAQLPIRSGVLILA